MACITLVPTLLAFVALALSLAGGLWCQTFQIESPQTIAGTDTFETGIFLHRKTDVVFDGPTLEDLDFNNLNATLEKYDACEPYSNEIFKDADVHWKSSMGFMCLSWLAGLIMTLALFASSCCGGSSRYYRALGLGILLFPLLFQGLVFLSMQSDLCKANPFLTELFEDQEFGESCEIGPSAGLIIGSMIGYFVAAISTCCLGRTPIENAKYNVKEKEKLSLRSEHSDDERQAAEPANTEEAEPSSTEAIVESKEAKVPSEGGAASEEGVELQDRGHKELAEVSVY